MEVKKIRLLASESIYLIGINAAIETHIKLFNTPCNSANKAKGEIDT